MSLIEPSKAYKPFKYPWAYEYWKRQQQVHWLALEVPLSDDMRDYREAERNNQAEFHLITNLFRFFTQADIEILECYHKYYQNIFKPTEVQMMLAAFSNTECFDDQSELLTSKGWKNVKDINEADRIAQYDIESGEVSFVLPKKVVSYDYEGIMHHYSGASTDICVTPNHDLIVKHPTSGVVKKVKSFENKLGRNYLYPGSGKSTAAHNELSALERLLIAVQADGCLRSNCPSVKDSWRTVDFTLHKERKVQRLEKLLSEAGVEYSLRREEGPRVRITFRLPDGIDMASVKSFGFFNLEEISAHKAVEIIEEVVLWDGTVNKNSGQKSYYTSNKDAADFIQAVATITGSIMATVGVNRDVGTECSLPNGKSHVMTKPHYVVTFTYGRTFKTFPHREEVEYNGKVYCVSVEKENLVSRRNGKVAFTGNTIHVDAYSHLIETVGMPDSEYTAFMDYKEMRNKADWFHKFSTNEPIDIATTLAGVSGFGEGLQLFGTFAVLMNFPRHNRFKGMGQIVSWSIRDETLHCEGIMRLYHEWLAENPGIDRKELRRRVEEICREAVDLEFGFIDLIFAHGPVQNLTDQDVKRYIMWLANIRMRELGFEPLYDVSEAHPLPWLPPLLSAPEHANFFEARATEYSKAATEGSWDDAW